MLFVHENVREGLVFGSLGPRRGDVDGNSRNHSR